jgi:hypothetical protein
LTTSTAVSGQGESINDVKVISEVVGVMFYYTTKIIDEIEARLEKLSPEILSSYYNAYFRGISNSVRM